MDMESFYITTLGHVDWDTILKTRQIHKSTHITLVFGRLQRVQHLGIIVNAEGSNHLSFVFLIVFLVHHLQRHHMCQISLIRKIAEAPPSRCPGHTHIASDPGIGFGCQQGNGIHLNVKLLSFGLLPVILISILDRKISAQEWAKVICMLSHFKD